MNLLKSALGKIDEIFKFVNDLQIENAKLREDLLSTPHPEVNRFKVAVDHESRSACMKADEENGAYVYYKDYVWMANYADRLVEFANLPCLPADLENLRASNLSFALENEQLKKAIQVLTSENKALCDHIAFPQ